MAASAAAEPVVPIRLNGPVANRINVVVLGDGYAQADMLKYATDVDLLIIGLFQQTPYADYSTYFNVFRVDVVSNESGVDHPETGVLKDTALGAAYNCGGSQRLICVNIALVNDVLSRSIASNARDIVVVLVNDSEYGGSGGSVSVASTHPQVVELMLHEMGHSVGLLGDEYTTQPPSCSSAVEPPEANASKEASSAVKWSYWIDAGTPLPTTSTTNGVPGTYLGSRYCPDTLYRPTFNSKMRSLDRPFEQINVEQLVRRFYNFVAPIDAVTPASPAIAPAPRSVVDFSVTRLQPPAHALRVRWTVDGAAAGEGATFQVATAGLSVGTHTVDLEVTDPTPAVRRDASSVLTERRRWTVTVREGGSGTELEDALERWRRR